MYNISSKFKSSIIILANMAFILSFLLIPSTGQAQSLDIQNLEVEVIDDDVQISWITPVKASGCVQLGLSSGQYDSQLCSTILERQHVIEIRNLHVNTQYHFVAISQTASGARVSSFDATFKTGKDATRDGRIEIENVRVIWVGATAATISWTTDVESNSKVEYSLISEDLGRRSSSSRRVTDHEVTLKGLKRASSYHFQVISEDKQGMISQSDVRRFRTASLEDIDKNDLEIRELKPVSTTDVAIGETTIAFSWRTTRPASAQVNYGIAPNRLSKRISQSTPRTLTHEIVVDELDPGTVYYFKVSSKDIFGKKAQLPGKDGSYSLKTKGVKPVSKSRSSKSSSRIPRTFKRDAQPVVTSPINDREIVLGSFTYIYTPATRLIKTKDNPRVYAVLRPSSDTKRTFKHWLKSPATFQSYGYRFSDVETVSVASFDSISDIKLAKAPSAPEIFYIDSARGVKLHLPTATIFNSYSSNRWEDVVTLETKDLDSFHTSSLVKLSNNSRVYLIENGQRRPIMTADAFGRMGFQWGNIVTINNTHMQSFPIGQQIN